MIRPYVPEKRLGRVVMDQPRRFLGRKLRLMPQRDDGDVEGFRRRPEQTVAEWRIGFAQGHNAFRKVPTCRAQDGAALDADFAFACSLTVRVEEAGYGRASG